jgi:hypothetical protein
MPEHSDIRIDAVEPHCSFAGSLTDQSRESVQRAR